MTKKEKADACTPATTDTERGERMDSNTIATYRTLRNTLLADEIIELRNDRQRLLSKLERIASITEQAMVLVEECPQSCERLRDRIDHIRIIASFCL